MEFLISTNPGEQPKPLAKIASGGELSRIMLAIKSVMSDKDRIPTVIYDEIDAGMSGMAARRVGQKLLETAHSGHQVICITHTAQIAACAQNHLLIEKTVREGRTYTEVHPPFPAGSGCMNWRGLSQGTGLPSWRLPMPRRCSS